MCISAVGPVTELKILFNLNNCRFGDVDEPASFINNRSWFMKALEEADWPIKEQDILLLEDEIAKAEKFMQQSKDLRKASSGNPDDDEITVYSDKDSHVSGLSARSKEMSKSKESVSSSASSASSHHTEDSQKSKQSQNSRRSRDSSKAFQSLEVIPQYS